MKCSKCGAVLESGRFCLECGNEVVTNEMIHKEKIEVARKYADKLTVSPYIFHVKGEIPTKKINNAISTYASRLDRETIIGLYDTTVLENGKEGIIFTDNEIIYKKYLESPRKLTYADIDHMDGRQIIYKNSSKEYWHDLNIGYDVGNFVNELLEINKKYGVVPQKRKMTKLDVMEKYGSKIPNSNYQFYLHGTIPSNIQKNAISRYAKEVSAENILGLIDMSVLGNGRTGILFSKEAMYQNVEDDFYRRMYYKDILDVEAENSEVKITFLKKDDYNIYYISTYWPYINHKIFVEFLNKIRNT